MRGDIRATVDRWRESAEAGGGQTPYAALRALAADYVKFRRDFERERRGEQRLTLQRDWFRQLLPALGYEWNPANHPLDDGDEVPVFCAVGGKAGAPALLTLGAYDAEAEGEDPLALKPHRLRGGDRRHPTRHHASRQGARVRPRAKKELLVLSHDNPGRFL